MFHESSIWTIAIVVATLALAGCYSGTSTVAFQIVDADTLQPLEGVSIERRSKSRMLFMRVSPEDGEPIDCGITAADGHAIVEDLRDTHSHTFFFTKPGYQGAIIYFVYDGRYPPDGDKDLYGQGGYDREDEVYHRYPWLVDYGSLLKRTAVIPMRRVPAGEPATTTYEGKSAE
jgi:hypothetical protein